MATRFDIVAYVHKTWAYVINASVVNDYWIVCIYSYESFNYVDVYI